MIIANELSSGAKYSCFQTWTELWRKQFTESEALDALKVFSCQPPSTPDNTRVSPCEKTAGDPPEDSPPDRGCVDEVSNAVDSE